MSSLGRVAGGAESQAKRQRTTAAAADGPIEDEDAARQKLIDAGFRPTNVATAVLMKTSEMWGVEYEWITPMIHFAYSGDLKMCRYLYSRGADTKFETLDFLEPFIDETGFFNVRDNTFWYPMYAAAIQGHLDVCKWLFTHGAAEDIRRRHISGHSPLSCVIETEQVDVAKWLTLSGALQDDVSKDINPETLRLDLRTRGGNTQRLQHIVADPLEAYATFQTFLMGTAAPRPFTTDSLLRMLVTRLGSEDAADMIMKNTPSDQRQQLWNKLLLAPGYRAPHHCLSGHPGIMERIGDFVGVARGRDLRIYRQIQGLLAEDGSLKGMR